MISLFAVITDFPLLSDDLIYALPGSIPPRTSITTSISLSLRISSKLSVRRLLSMFLSLLTSETKTFFSVRFSSVLSIVKRRSITAEPIFPAPSTAILTFDLLIISKNRCYKQ